MVEQVELCKQHTSTHSLIHLSSLSIDRPIEGRCCSTRSAALANAPLPKSNRFCPTNRIRSTLPEPQGNRDSNSVGDDDDDDDGSASARTTTTGAPAAAPPGAPPGVPPGSAVAVAARAEGASRPASPAEARGRGRTTMRRRGPQR